MRGGELEDMQRKAVIGDLGGVRISARQGVEMERRKTCIINFPARKIALMLPLIKLHYLFVPLSELHFLDLAKPV